MLQTQKRPELETIEIAGHVFNAETGDYISGPYEINAGFAEKYAEELWAGMSPEEIMDGLRNPKPLELRPQRPALHLPCPIWVA